MLIPLLSCVNISYPPLLFVIKSLSHKVHLLLWVMALSTLISVKKHTHTFSLSFYVVKSDLKDSEYVYNLFLNSSAKWKKVGVYVCVEREQI